MSYSYISEDITQLGLFLHKQIMHTLLTILCILLRIRIVVVNSFHLSYHICFYDHFVDVSRYTLAPRPPFWIWPWKVMPRESQVLPWPKMFVMCPYKINSREKTSQWKWSQKSVRFDWQIFTKNHKSYNHGQNIFAKVYSVPHINILCNLLWANHRVNRRETS